ENHVRLRARLPDARDVDRRIVLDGAHLLARAAPDAERRIDVRALQVDRLHRRLLAIGARLRGADPRGRLFDPDRLRRRRAELLAHDARRLHAPRQTTPLVVERRADLHRRNAEAELLLLRDLLDGPRGADLTAENARVLAVADARDQDRRPNPLDPRLE